MADAHFGACAPYIERYQMAVGAKARQVVAKTDRVVESDELEGEAACEALEEANRRVAEMLRAETDGLLDHVLFEVSMRMMNGFSRSDG